MLFANKFNFPYWGINQVRNQHGECCNTMTILWHSQGYWCHLSLNRLQAIFHLLTYSPYLSYGLPNTYRRSQSILAKLLPSYTPSNLLFVISYDWSDVQKHYSNYFQLRAGGNLVNFKSKRYFISILRHAFWLLININCPDHNISTNCKIKQIL